MPNTVQIIPQTGHDEELEFLKVDPEIRNYIEMLNSSDARERGRAVEQLGNMGSKATPAIPYLIDVLGDNVSLEKISSDIQGTRIYYTTPSYEAQKALKLITGKDLGENTTEWQDWWNKNKVK